MIFHLFSNESSSNSFEKLEESSFINRLEESFSINTLEEESPIKTLKRKIHLSSNDITEISEAEIRILNWLEENGVVHSIPEEKEFEYYERKRNESKNSFLQFQIEIENPLLQRRKNSLSNKNKDIWSSSRSSPILKLSKFQTSKCSEVEEQHEIKK